MSDPKPTLLQMPGTENDVSWDSFGVAFSALRQRSSMTLADVADALNDRYGETVTVPHLSRVGRDITRPGTELIVRIAALFDVPPEYFLHYRLAQARASLDDRPPGSIEKAVESLRALTRGQST